MTKEACPKCKSEKVERVQIEGEDWWVCRFQGCDGRVSGDWYHFRPGQGLAIEPKPEKKPKRAEKPEADETPEGDEKPEAVEKAEPTAPADNG